MSQKSSLNFTTAKKSLTKLTPVLSSKFDNITDNKSKPITHEHNDQLVKQPSYRVRTNRSQFNPVLQAKHDRDSNLENEDRKQKSGREREWTKVDAARYVYNTFMFIHIQEIIFRYYLSNSRYSPLTNTQLKTLAGPAFGSTAPRWPVKTTVESVNDKTYDLQPQV